MELTPQTIREVEFREKLRGYHPDDVDAFVEQVAAGFERLLERLRELEGQGGSAEGVSEDVIRRTLVMAQRTADLVLSEAQETAAKLVNEAQSEADTLVGDAKAEAGVLVSEAQSEAVQVAQDARARAEAEIARLQAERGRLLDDVTALRDYADRHRARMRQSLLDHLQALDVEAAAQEEPPVAPDVEPAGGASSSKDPTTPRLSGVDKGGSPDGAPLDEFDADEVTDSTAGSEAEDAPPIDMIARARDIASLVPGQGEEDPFLEELRRAVDDHDELSSRSRATDPLSARRPSDVSDELRGIPDGGRLSGRLFRRR